MAVPEVPAELVARAKVLCDPRWLCVTAGSGGILVV